MTTNYIDAMKQALEALDVATTPLNKDRQEILAAKAALRAAITEAEQQGPVAWGRDDGTYITNAEHNELLHHDNWAQGFDTALYTTPQPATPVWQPIETAPKDGTVFLGYRDGRMREAYRVPRDDCEMWVFGGSSGSVEIAPQLKPTHWMPLLAAPKPGENHD